MNLVIFGPTGPTGRLLVEQALEQGHAVTAFARNPTDLKNTHPALTILKGDIVHRDSVDLAIKGQQAVISALGIRKLRKHTTLSDGTKNIVASMKHHHVRRFVCMTSLGVGDSKGQPAWFFNWVVLPLFLRHIFADKAAQEMYVEQSGLDWIIVRPAGLTNGPRTGVYKHWVGQPKEAITSRISRADVADFMLKQLTDDTYLHQMPGLSY
jgi:putative NADH-flavin reductase